MKTMVKTEQEIILETVETYSDPSNRAIYPADAEANESTCQYRAENGNMCAVGRCMTGYALETWASSTKNIIVIASTANNVDNILKPEYHGHNVGFWNDLQVLHDTDYYWSEDGITEKGIEFIKKAFDIEI